MCQSLSALSYRLFRVAVTDKNIELHLDIGTTLVERRWKLHLRMRRLELGLL